MNIKNVLITGSSGFIGSYISNYLAKKKYTIFCIKNKKKLRLSKKIYTPVTLATHHPIEAVVHCASKTSANSNNSKIVMDQNINLLKKLLIFAKRKKIKKIIFLSTMSVYGKINSQLVNENTQFDRPDFYGKSKIRCEQLLKTFCKNNKVRFLIVRLPGVVGPGSHGNFISKMGNKIIKSKKIKLNNKNKDFNNILHVKNLSEFIQFFLKSKKNNSLILNLASKGKLKIENLFKNFILKLNKKTKVTWINKPTPTFIISTSKAIKAGFKPYSVKKSIGLYAKDLRD